MNKELIGETIELDNGNKYIVLNVVDEDNKTYGFIMPLDKEPRLDIVEVEGDALYLVKDNDLKNRLTEKYKNKENH